LAYGDYSDQSKDDSDVEDVIQWLGWDNPQLQSAVTNLKLQWGGDWPEAVKTGLVHALKYIDPERKTLVIWYADAGPHHSSNGDHYKCNSKEVNALSKIGEDPDWVRLSHRARDNNCTVFSLIQAGLEENQSRFFALLSSLTGGKVVTTPARTSEEVSQLTMDILLAWMGEPLGSPKYNTSLLHFRNSPHEASPPLTDEEEGSFGYLPSKETYKPKQELVTTPLQRVDDANLRAFTEPLNLDKKYLDKEAEEYRHKVHNALRQIIDYNVVAMTYNPVFGEVSNTCALSGNNWLI
jgi:hypothetical protein